METTNATLIVLTENIETGKTVNTDPIARSKQILRYKEERPEFIEVDNRTKNAEPIIRVKFSDDKFWKGTMCELRTKLLS